jgi:hypothetical protein
MSDYTDRHGAVWHTLTVDELKDGPIFDQVEASIESWLPNYVSDTGRVSSYDDLIEKAVDGLHLDDGRKADLGPDYDSPLFRRLKAIARRIVKETT